MLIEEKNNKIPAVSVVNNLLNYRHKTAVNVCKNIFLEPPYPHNEEFIYSHPLIDIIMLVIEQRKRVGIVRKPTFNRFNYRSFWVKNKILEKKLAIKWYREKNNLIKYQYIKNSYTISNKKEFKNNKKKKILLKNKKNLIQPIIYQNRIRKFLLNSTLTVRLIEDTPYLRGKIFYLRHSYRPWTLIRDFLSKWTIHTGSHFSSSLVLYSIFFYLLYKTKSFWRKRRFLHREIINGYLVQVNKGFNRVFKLTKRKIFRSWKYYFLTSFYSKNVGIDSVCCTDFNGWYMRSWRKINSPFLVNNF